MPDYMTVSEMVKTLRLGERTVYQMLRCGRIPGAARAGGKWRVERAKVIDWMAGGGELAVADEVEPAHKEEG